MMRSTGTPFSLKISCPHCGQAGFVAWEGAGAHDPAPERHPRLVFLSRGFHHENGRARSGAAMIVCDICDTIQEELVQGSVH
jgi:hypothetical protein